MAGVGEPALILHRGCPFLWWEEARDSQVFCSHVGSFEGGVPILQLGVGVGRGLVKLFVSELSVKLGLLSKQRED